MHIRMTIERSSDKKNRISTKTRTEKTETSFFPKEMTEKLKFRVFSSSFRCSLFFLSGMYMRMTIERSSNEENRVLSFEKIDSKLLTTIVLNGANPIDHQVNSES